MNELYHQIRQAPPLNLILQETSSPFTAKGCHLRGRHLVIEGEFQGRPAVAKLFKNRKTLQRELTAYDYLVKANIPTATLLQQDTLNNYPTAIFEKLTPGQSLDHYLNESLENTMLEKFIDMVVQQHRQGLCQKDCNLENYLISTDKLYCQNINTINTCHAGRSLPWQVGLDNLCAYLASSVIFHANNHLDLFHYYLKMRDIQPSERLINGFNMTLVRQRRDYIYRHIKCSFNNNRIYQQLKLSGHRISFNASECPEETIKLFIQHQTLPDTLQCQYFTENPCGKLFSLGLATSKAEKYWRKALWAYHCDPNNPQPMALIERKTLGFITASLLLIDAKKN